MPDRILPVLAAYLWDLRSQCESQVRALTDAQRQIDIVRDGRTGKVRDAAVQLLRDLQRVAKANADIRAAVHDALQQAQQLGAMYEVDQGK